MHPESAVSNQKCDGALWDQYTAMGRCRRMGHGVNVSLLLLRVVLVAVCTHVVHVW